jgi:hypothetical protein
LAVVVIPGAVSVSAVAYVASQDGWSKGLIYEFRATSVVFSLLFFLIRYVSKLSAFVDRDLHATK